MRKHLLILLPVSFVIGSSVELFMIKTGFYEIVTKKHSERLQNKINEENRQIDRMKELGIDVQKLYNNNNNNNNNNDK